jgi:hypothetical protein
MSCRLLPLFLTSIEFDCRFPSVRYGVFRPLIKRNRIRIMDINAAHFSLHDIQFKTAV